MLHIHDHTCACLHKKKYLPFLLIFRDHEASGCCLSRNRDRRVLSPLPVAPVVHAPVALGGDWGARTMNRCDESCPQSLPQ